jgi:hypothetical protein
MIPGSKGPRASLEMVQQMTLHAQGLGSLSTYIPRCIPEISEIPGSGTFQERIESQYLNPESQWNIAECVVGCHRSSNDDMGI